MANNPSTIKRIRQTTKRRLRNRNHVTSLRSSVKLVRAAVEEGNAEQARELLPAALRNLDRAAQKGTIHANAAARSKSRLTRLVASAG